MTGYCAAWPDGTVAHLLPFAEVRDEPRLVVVPCPDHDTPGHMFAAQADPS